MLLGERLRDIVTNVLDSDIVVSEFKLQLRHCVHFWSNKFEKDTNSLIFASYGLNGTNSVLL